MKRVIIPQAQQDIEEIAAYYAKREEGDIPRLFGTPLAVSVILAVIGVRVESLTSAKVPGLVAHLPSAQREAPHPALVACA